MPKSSNAIFDTSSLIFLDYLCYISSVQQLHNIIVTSDIVQELEQKEHVAGAKVPLLPGIIVKNPQTTYLDLVQQETNLGLGETSVIALGLELGKTIVLDDNLARKYAIQKGLNLTGTLGVVVRIHKANLESRSLEQDLQELSNFGMYISDEIKSVILDK